MTSRLNIETIKIITLKTKRKLSKNIQGGSLNENIINEEYLDNLINK